MKRKIIDITVMLICTSIFFWCAVAYINNKNIDENKNKTQESESSEELVINSSADLTIWYNDSKIEPYLQEMARQYSSGMDIELVQVSVLDYLENINKLNIKGEGMPDLYVLDSEMLEKASLAGLTVENNDDVYNEDNYAKVALRAATYKDKLVAYPFYFNTSFFVYNEDYVENSPKTFDEILAFANSFDGTAEENVQNILKWDVNSLLYNYAFVGDYIEFGGENGDDSTDINLNNEKLKQCLNYYHSLYQYFSIDINSVNYDTVVDEFINGKTIFTILSIDSLDKLNKSKINYKITDFPDLTKDLDTNNLSATKVIVVNTYAKDKEEAQKFAKFLTYDKVENIYNLTGYIGSRQLNSYSVNGIDEIMQQYAQSDNLPKLMIARDFWVQLQNTLNSAWVGEDINAELDNLQSKYTNQN